MSTTIRNNIAAQSVANHTASQAKGLSQTMRRVSTGQRITQAADDAAGSAVSVHLQARANSARQAARNINDGLSVAQIADDGNKELVGKLQRMRELAVQSASETLESEERAFLQDEWTSNFNSIRSAALRTTWNGRIIFTGGTMDVQVGIDGDSNNQISIALPSHSGVYNGLIGYDVSTVSTAQKAMSRLDEALDFTADFQASVGSSVQRLESAMANVTAQGNALTDAASRIQDADYAEETAKMTAGQIRQQAGIAAIAQASNLARPVVDLI